MEALSTALVQVTGSSKLPLIPFSEWFNKLDQVAANATPKIMQHVPGVKLLHIYRSMASADQANRATNELVTQHEAVGQVDIDTCKMQSVSETLRDVKPLSAEDAVRWVTYWHSKGFFGEDR